MSKEAPRDVIACENIVLHHASAVQLGSGLLLLDPITLDVVAANRGLLSQYATLLRLEDVFQAQDADLIRRELASDEFGPARNLRLNCGAVVWVRFYGTGDYIAIDLTYAKQDQSDKGDFNHQFARCIADLSQVHDLTIASEANELSPYLDKLVCGVQSLIGFDRVMIYKFDTDLNGEVLAEARTSNAIPSFKGLKFPSGDIPKPARDLFLRNKVRQIIDTDGGPDIVVSTSQSGQEVVFDQTLSSFRYTAPIHLEYLKNMGVTASLTIGIVVGQKLWGLVSCHHLTGPRQIEANNLMLCHVLSDLASNQIARLMERQREAASAKTKTLLSMLSHSNEPLQAADDFEGTIACFQRELLDLLGADGIHFESETTNWIIGSVPDRDATKHIDSVAKQWLQENNRTYVATADLARLCPNLHDKIKPISGLMHIRSWDSKSCLRVYRKTTMNLSTWAGDPDAKARYAEISDNALHPRNSFEAFKETVAGCSDVWDHTEIQILGDLHAGLRNLEMTFHKAVRERQLRQSNAELRGALKDAEYQAHHDPLTELANRRGFETFLNDLQHRKDRPNTMWLCHIDIDHFKNINDTYGHLAGDAVLQHIAKALKRAAPPNSTAARIGGDEFTLILPGNIQDIDVRNICASLIDTLSVPIVFNDISIDVSCTCGVTSFAAGTENSSDILARSDLALYRGKANGRGVFEFFTKCMEHHQQARLSIEDDIKAAIKNGEFTPYFQPQIDVRSKAVVGIEMLARWRHPTKGILTPQHFLSVAQAIGVQDVIDRQLFFQAVTFQSDWADRTGRRIPISVNVTLERLRSADLLNDLQSLGGDASSISLELLEAIDLSDDDAVFDVALKKLRQTGVGIEIDDFGAGRTSLLSVLRLKPDRLKIDKRLIDPIVKDIAARDVVKSVIEIGQHLGISMVAEGVERTEQFDILADLGCEQIQGYLVGHPQSADATLRALNAAA